MLLAREEQGVEIGRLARGLVHVTPPPAQQGAPSIRPLRAPLLLQDVRIEPRTSGETDHVLEVGNDVEVNRVLLVALRDHHGVDFDIDAVTSRLETAIERTVDPDAQTDAAFDVVRVELAAQGRESQLEQCVVLGTFSFDKLPMVEDLRRSADLLAAHDVIAAAAGDQSARSALRTAAGAWHYREPDQLTPSSLSSTPIHLSIRRSWPYQADSTL
jgi:hypothetical protein